MEYTHMTTFATTARPKNVAIAWATKSNIFLEIPCKDGPPYICRYHRNVDGLAAALNILVANAETETRTITRDHPRIAKNIAKVPETSRERAREVLKKMGLT